ncbi:MAG: acylphosphatase [Ginsengibacter sp.]
METVHLIISGKVQGVFYRASAKKKAEQLNVRGWIKNTPEGNVEATVTGEAGKIQDFIQWCQSGPDKAVIKDIKIYKQDFQEFDAFTIKR